LKFQDELEAYIECHGTSLVPTGYVNPVSGYTLGWHIATVRRGVLWRGHTDEAIRMKWLESLPGWAWNAMETDEWREDLSERSKAQWANADETTRGDWCRKFSEAHNRPEVKTAASERARAQAEREAAEGKTSLAERGKATRTENWTKEQRDAVQAKRDATTAAKRAAVLAALPESERPKKQAEFDRNDLKEANRCGKANALLQLPSYAEKGYQWRYRNLTQATNDGVVFFQDPSGVWCARACGDQGAGSSSEHARTVEETAAEELEAEVAEAPEEPADLVPRVAEMVAGA
jgi:hypothetical protein